MATIIISLVVGVVWGTYAAFFDRYKYTLGIAKTYIFTISLSFILIHVGYNLLMIVTQLF